jgi:hypothetical protein
VKKMKKSVSLLSNLLLSSSLFWGVATAQGEQVTLGEILKVPSSEAGYCHMQFPPMREDSLSWTRPVLNETAPASIDFYGPCDHDPLGTDEIQAQRRVLLRGIFEDSE